MRRSRRCGVVSVDFRRERDLHFSAPCLWWSASAAYNCIVLLSHSVSALICLFNIQLSTLDLEASVTALSSIRSGTSAADFSQDPLEGWSGEGRVAAGKDDSETGGEKRNRAEKQGVKMLSLRQR